jgi:major membrane immunogen (membrane-anchored lipoprotein)
MFKKLILCFVAASAFLLTSCGPSQKDAIQYNDQIVGIQKSLLPPHQAFINQFDGHNLDSLKITHELFMAKAKGTLEECQKMTDFNGKREYLESALDYFKTIQGLADNEGKQLVQILTKDSSQITEKDVADVTAIATKFDSDYAKVLKKVQDAQVVFAKEWKFEIKAD